MSLTRKNITVINHPILQVDHKQQTCRIVSKLNVSPFQRVNSPELAPVTRRRPSGVQASVKIGQRILLVAVLTKRVVTALVGLSG